MRPNNTNLRQITLFFLLNRTIENISFSKFLICGIYFCSREFLVMFYIHFIYIPKLVLEKFWGINFRLHIEPKYEELKIGEA